MVSTSLGILLVTWVSSWLGLISGGSLHEEFMACKMGLPCVWFAVRGQRLGMFIELGLTGSGRPRVHLFEADVQLAYMAHRVHVLDLRAAGLLGWRSSGRGSSSAAELWRTAIRRSFSERGFCCRCFVSCRAVAAVVVVVVVVVVSSCCCCCCCCGCSSSSLLFFFWAS